MKKTLLILLLAFVVFIAVGSVIDPAAHNTSNSLAGAETNSRWYYVSHPYIAYRTYSVAPVVVYRPYYVAPVYPVYRAYPVYTYQYWYNRFVTPQKPVIDNSQEIRKTGFDQLTK